MTAILLFEGKSLLSNSISGLCLLKSLPAERGFAVVTNAFIHADSFTLNLPGELLPTRSPAMLNKKKENQINLWGPQDVEGEN